MRKKPLMGTCKRVYAYIYCGRKDAFFATFTIHLFFFRVVTVTLSELVGVKKKAQPIHPSFFP